MLDAEGLPEVVRDGDHYVLLSRGAGAPSPELEREVLHDALLLRFGHVPGELTGREVMADRYRGTLPPAERHERLAPELAELARLSGIEPRKLAQLGEEQLRSMLERARHTQREQQRAAREALQRELRELGRERREGEDQ